MFVSNVLKKCANLITHDSKQNGSISKEQAEVLRNETPINNKEPQSNPSAAATSSNEEWERHGKENIENQLSRNQKDVVTNVENIAMFHEEQNRKLQVHDISVSDTSTDETSYYLDGSNTIPLNITDICDNFTNVLSISNEKQSSLQQENVSAYQYNYFGEGGKQVVQDDIKTIACEGETIASSTSENNDENKKSSANAQGSSVIVNLTFESKDEQKTENQQENEVVSCDNKNSNYHQNICEVKLAQTLTEGKNDDIACVENLAEIPGQNSTINEIITSLPQSQTEDLCLELQLSEINVESVAAVENSIISPLKCQIQGENKPSGDVQSSPEEFNLRFEHEFEQTVIIKNEKQLDEIIQKEPTGDDDVNVPPGTQVRSTMSERELEQNSISVNNGVNDRNSSSHCDTEVQTKQQESKSCSDNVGSFPSSTSLEINLASELQQTNKIISNHVGAAENNMSVCNSEKQENVGSEEQSDIFQEETSLNVVSPEKNDICNTVSTGELAYEGTRAQQENINDEKGNNVGNIKQYPTAVVEEDFAQEGNKTCDVIETDSKEWKDVNFEKQIHMTEERTLLDVATAEKAETHHQDLFSNINILKGDNIDDIQPNTTPVAEENLALEANTICNNTKTNTVDSEKQTDIAQATSIPDEKNGVWSDVNITSELPIVIHHEDPSSNVRNETRDYADAIQKYTTSVVGQDLVQEKSKMCNDVRNRTINSGSKEQKNEDSGKQGETAKDKTILNVNSSVSKESGIYEDVNAAELPPEGNDADKDVIDLDNNDKGVQGDESKEQSSCKPRNSLLLGFGPTYASKSPTTNITEENCQRGSSDVEDAFLFGSQLRKADINLHQVIETTQINNQEIQESEAFFDAVMSDDATNNVGKLLDISQIFPEEAFTQEKCSGSNLVCLLNETADMNTGASDVSDSHSKNISGKSIADVSGELAILEEINAELKLQLDASQQAQCSLELQLHQKEKVILKNREETLRKDEAYRQEINQLKAKLEEKCVVNDTTDAKELQEAIKSIKNREAKLISELNAYKSNEQNYKKIMDEYEDTIGTQVVDLKRLSKEHETVKRHLANLELAFSDVHQKYERSKKIIDGYKCNEDALRQTLITSEESVFKSEQKYESLKSHAKVQIEKSNQAMHAMRQQSEFEIHKLSSIIKRLEITNAALKESLDQKKKECVALATLCDEVTGKM